MGKFQDFIFEARLKAGRVSDEEIGGRFYEVGQGLWVGYRFQSDEAWEAYYRDKPPVYLDYPPIE